MYMFLARTIGEEQQSRRGTELGISARASLAIYN